MKFNLQTLKISSWYQSSFDLPPVPQNSYWFIPLFFDTILRISVWNSGNSFFIHQNHHNSSFDLDEMTESSTDFTRNPNSEYADVTTSKLVTELFDGKDLMTGKGRWSELCQHATNYVLMMELLQLQNHLILSSKSGQDAIIR